MNALCDIEWRLLLKSNCADVVHLSHVMERVRDLIPFMEKVYRACKSGAEVQVAILHYTSRGAFFAMRRTFDTSPKIPFSTSTDRPTTACRPIFGSKLFSMIRANHFDICPSMRASVAGVIFGTWRRTCT